MNDFKPNYYSVIPANVRYDSDLTANAKLLYGEITALTNEKGYCWATNNYFAKLYKTSNVTISRWIKSLKDKGYITTKIKYKDGTKEIENRYIQICPPINKNVNTPINKNVNTPINKNVKDNNTSMNNINMNNNIITTTNNSIYNNINSDLENIIDNFSSNIHSITPFELEKIKSWLNVFDGSILNKAIEIATLNNIKTMNYIEGILRIWKSNNFKSLADIENYIDSKNQRKIEKNKKQDEPTEWFNEKITDEINESESQEMEDLLNSIIL